MYELFARILQNRMEKVLNENQPRELQKKVTQPLIIFN